MRKGVLLEMLIKALMMFFVMVPVMGFLQEVAISIRLVLNVLLFWLFGDSWGVYEVPFYDRMQLVLVSIGS